MDNDNNALTSLSTMLGSGGSFKVKEKYYTIKPIVLKHIEDFMKDNLSVGTQFFNIANKKSREKVDRWLSEYCFDDENNLVTLEIVMADGWDVVDLKEFFKKLCDFSD